ncbi:MAG TPA: site-specific DNA-methyltransferase [Firmicutes bacterium]|nr:site-specific DNA-methyltransferase [Bacillota bacterium]
MPNGFRKKDSARLVWDTKPRRAPNPKDIEFQTAEVVIPNPARDEGQIPLSFRDGLFGEDEIDKQEMNRLIWGDNLLAMQALLAQGYEGKINLIYIDPPFDSKADYSHRMVIEGNEFTKEPSVIERLAYKDTWAGGTDSYLDMLYPRLQLMKRLLAENGSLYVHCDYRTHAYIRLMLDEIFSRNLFLNEIIWCYNSMQKSKRNWNRKHDVILMYVKSDAYTFNAEEVLEEYDPGYRARFKYRDEKGWYMIRGKGGTQSPIHSQGDLTPEHEIMYPGWTYRQYLKEGGYPKDWWEIDFLNSNSKERTGFDTQKPKQLLQKIIKCSSNPGDLVADFFCGSGTTLVVAEELGRRWIGCELGKVGVQVTRSRLVKAGARPFLIENIGNYQREMIYLTGGRIWEMQHLILKLYGATPRDKLSGLGVRRAEDGVEELVYVGYPDRPVTAKKVEELALAAEKMDGAGYRRLVVLGWDYEYNYHEALEARLRAHTGRLKVQVASRDVPPDIYDYLKKAKSEEDIEALADKVQFFERPYLRVGKPQVKALSDGRQEVSIAIDRYVLMDIPISRTTKQGQASYETLLELAKDNFAVLIDYWAVDWDYDGFTFRSQWQAFRGNGKKARTVPTEAKEVLEAKPKRTLAVRVVDIFGNDAAATVEIGG